MSDNTDSGYDRDLLLKVMNNVQGHICSYHQAGKAGPSGFCDCKFGGEGLLSKVFYTGEKTGCPEIRVAIAILTEMTDHEYKRILKRLQKRSKVDIKWGTIGEVENAESKSD